MFYDVFKRLCDEKGVSCNRAATEMGLSNATATKWKKTGATPSGDTLSKIAVYFDVSIDDLLGNEEKPAGQEADELIKNDPLAGQLFAAYGKVKEEFSQAEIDDITMIMEMIAEKKRRKREKGEE